MDHIQAVVEIAIEGALLNAIDERNTRRRDDAAADAPGLPGTRPEDGEAFGQPELERPRQPADVAKKNRSRLRECRPRIVGRVGVLDIEKSEQMRFEQIGGLRAV